jgi:hypothetical protein
LRPIAFCAADFFFEHFRGACRPQLGT